jgi:predicted RNA binding protein YcfA (HicA-like mRNA interferase family)
MGKLSVINGSDLVKLLTKFGWEVVRQKGSHIIMVKKGEIVSLSVPKHTEVAKGTLRSLLRNAGISIDDYHEALKK